MWTDRLTHSVPVRPAGIDPAIPYEHRTSFHDYIYDTPAIAISEWTGENPWFEGTFSRAIGALAGLMHLDNGTPGAAAAAEPGAWTFDAIGDFGAGTAQEARNAAQMLREHPDLVITVGDNVYPSGRWKDYASYFDPTEFYGVLAHAQPFYPALGNHDIDRLDLRPYFGHFPQVKGQPYYTYVKNNAQFFVIDSDQKAGPGSLQYLWLEAALKHSKSKWKIVYMHYPMHSSNAGGDRELRGWLEPLLQHYGVQLVLSGHEHDYQRSFPIGGMTHIITGGGGEVVFPFVTHLSNDIAFRAAKYEHLQVSVGQRHLVVRAVDDWGATFDTVVIASVTPG